MAKLGKIALGVGCGVVLLTIGGLVFLLGGGLWLESAMQRQGGEPLTAMEIDCEVAREGDAAAVRGSVLNGGEGLVREVQVTLQWTDASGSPLEEDRIDTADARGLAPGEKTAFEHLREDPQGAIHGVACQVQCVSTEQARICR